MGLIDYNGDSKKLKKICELLNVTDVKVDGVSVVNSSGIANITGGGGGGSSTLAGLTDVSVSGVTDGDLLAYDDDLGKWVDVAPPTVNDATLTIKAGDVSKGTFTANASSNVNIVVMPFSITENPNGGYDVTYPS